MDHKKMAQSEKAKLAELISFKSQRDCEKTLLAIAPRAFENQETERAVTPNLQELKFYIKTKTQEKIIMARNLLSHVDPNMSYADLLDRLLEEFLRHHDPFYARENLKKRRENMQIRGSK